MFVTYENNCFIYEMAKLTSAKRKNYVLTKKKSLVGLTPGYIMSRSTYSGSQMLSTRSVRNGLVELSESVDSNLVRRSRSCPLLRKTLLRRRCDNKRLHKSGHGLWFQNRILEIFRWKYLSILFSFLNLGCHILFTHAPNASIYRLQSVSWI